MPPEPEEGPVWIVDTSALINFKTLIGVSDQWDAFKLLEQLVEQGRIAMPRQVVNEASEIAHPDLPGAWAPGVRSRLRYPLDVDYEHIQRVMREAGDVVDRMPIKISLTTACGRLGVRHVGSRGFLTSCGINVRRAPVHGDGEDE